MFSALNDEDWQKCLINYQTFHAPPPIFLHFLARPPLALIGLTHMQKVSWKNIITVETYFKNGKISCHLLVKADNYNECLFLELTWQPVVIIMLCTVAILITSLIPFSLKGWENVLFELGIIRSETSVWCWKLPCDSPTKNHRWNEIVYGLVCGKVR